jgi:flavin-dependent dehydrogenase
VSIEVAIIGGGPAGAITAALLARSGREVLVLERAPAWRWRACGVFTSPATVPALQRVGLSSADLAAVAQPITAMRVETPRGQFRLDYRGPAVTGPPVGLDRGRLDPLLLDLARHAGAEVREGAAARSVTLPAGNADLGRVELADGAGIEARVIVGADGVGSIVAQAAAVARRSPLGARIGLTFHVADPEPGAHDARMVLFDDGYVGLAPVPGARLNVGIVLGQRWFAALRREGAGSVAMDVLSRVGSGGGATLGPALDAVAGASPLGGTVRRRAGNGWLLVGDAAGFLDPFTGEGLHRAIVSAELAATAISESLEAAHGSAPAAAQLRAYDPAMRSRFGTKDLVTRVVQAFLARPALFGYAARRLADRDELRDTMAQVIGDLVPARRAFDPRFLGALLRP